MICKDCKNGNICKYRAETEEIWKKAEKELCPSNILSPVTVKIECRHFEKQPQKQDGIWSK